MHSLELWRNFICGNETGSPGRAVSLHLARSGSQSEHRIRRILPARLACHTIINNYCMGPEWAMSNYRLTHSASELSGFTCTSSLTMNEKFQYHTRPPSAVLKNLEFRGYEGERSNFYSKIQLVAQKNIKTKHLS